MPDLRDTLLERPSLCPVCGYMLSGAMTADPANPDATPAPGDFSVCISCVTLLVFNDDLTVRAATPEEREAALKEQPELEANMDRAVRAVRASHRVLGKPNDLNPRSRRH